MERTGLVPEYRLIDLDELMEYMWLKPEDTTLGYDIFIDDGEAYVRGQHPLLIFVRNGKDRICAEFIPVSVSDTPIILDKSIKLKIGESELSEIINFIKVNLDLLREMAGGNMHPDDFVAGIKLYNESEECDKKKLNSLKLDK